MGLLDRVKALPATVRSKRPGVDHVVRAYGRYSAEAGDRLAASVALPGFLSFFPLLAIAFFVLGFVLTGSGSAQRSVLDAVSGYVPGLLCTTAPAVPQFPCGPNQLDIAKIGAARNAAGVIGILGLLIAGTGWVDALRAGIRSIWHQNIKDGNVVVVKLRDTLILAGLGLGLLISLSVSGFAGSATSTVLSLLDLEGSAAGDVGVKLVGYVVTIAVNLGLFLFLFSALPRVQAPRRRVLRGSLLAAVGFLLLQLVGATYLKRTTSNPVYGSFAAIVGLAIWVNLLCRFVLFCAAWTVTAPYDSDVAPSGTASAEAARKAGIPVEYAGGGTDDPATSYGGGAPSPLRAALSGQPPPQAEPVGAGTVAGDGAGAPIPAGPRAGHRVGAGLAALSQTPAEGEEVPHASAARAAGHAAVGFVAVSLGGVVLANGRALLRVLRGRG